MKSWMNSPGHKSNILNRDFTHIGVACVKSGYGYSWVQMFVGTNRVPSSSGSSGSSGNQTETTRPGGNQEPSTPSGSGQNPGTTTNPDQNPGTTTNPGQNPGTTTNPGQNPGSTTNPGSSQNPGSSSNSSGSSNNTNPYLARGPVTSTELPEDGRVTHYRREWQNGEFFDVEVVNGNHIRFTGRYTIDTTYYNYAVLEVFSRDNPNNSDCERLVSGQPFSLEVEVNVSALEEIYKDDLTKATSIIETMLCQNYHPGDRNKAGIGIGADLSLALDGNGGIEFRVREY